MANITQSAAQIDGKTLLTREDTVLSTLTASSSSSLVFTGITSAVAIYRFEFQHIVPATDAVVFRMRMSTNAGSSYDSSSIYGWSYTLALLQASTGHSAEGGNNDSGIQLGGGQLDNYTAYGMSGWLELYNPLSSTLYKQIVGQFIFKDNRDSITSLRNQAGIYKSATPVDAVEFTMSSGNIASGVIRVLAVPQ